MMSARDIPLAARGWLHLQRASLAKRRHPDQGEISAYCFYNTRLRFGETAFDIGANHGEITALMVNRGARVVAVEPQADLARELERRFPSVTVLAAAVAETPGQAELHLAREGDQLASLDPQWEANANVTVTWDRTVTVPVITLDEMIDRHGLPKLVKIDTEGFDHKVLQGLSQPIDHVLFEVHAAFPHVPAAAFAALQDLGRYEFNVFEADSWMFQPARPQEILADIPWWGNVYARRM